MQNVTITLFQFFHTDATAVHGKMADSNLLCGVNAGNFCITGIFNGIDFFSSQKLNQQTIQVLCTGADDHLLRGYLHATKLLQMLCYGSA